MANHKSAAKRARQSEKRVATNSKIKSSVRTFEKKLRKAIEDKNSDAAKTMLVSFESKIGKAAQKGTVHPRTVARKVSRLSKQVHSLGK